MPRVLLIDDDPSLLDVLAMALEDAGHSVTTAVDGVAGLQALSRADVVVSDVNMPRLDGFAFCRKVRASGSRVPILLLTSRDTDIDEALGLELGADDYVTKPFSTRVLLARVNALLRREAARALPPAATSRGALELDLERIEARWRGTAVGLTVTEFRLVETLSSRPGVVWSRAQVMERMRGDNSVVEDRIVDTYVRRLRRTFEAADPAFDGIETVVGAGYRWRG
jgi:DNA-binding response OmpR family regulator